jgi:hypothetical protein
MIRDDQAMNHAEIEELHRGDPDPAIFSPPEGYKYQGTESTGCHRHRPSIARISAPKP